MDRLDYEILSVLQQDGRRSFTEIGKKLGVSEGTIRKRVMRLVDDGVIRIIGLVDPHLVGFDAPRHDPSFGFPTPSGRGSSSHCTIPGSQLFINGIR
jgi:hypothetical protein